MFAAAGGLQRAGQDRRCRRGRAADDRPYKRVHVSPFPMFSNGNLKTLPFSFFNSQFAPGVVHVAVNDRRYGRVQAGSGGTGNPSPTGAAGRVHVAVNDRRCGRA